MNNPKSKFVPRYGEDHRRRIVAVMQSQQRLLREPNCELGAREFEGRRCPGRGGGQPPVQRFKRRAFFSAKDPQALQKIVQIKATPAPLPDGAAGMEINHNCSYAHEQEARSERHGFVLRLAKQTKVVFLPIGLGQIKARFPECFVQGGIMERNNFSAAAGFGFHSGRTGIVATFSAFLEMCISELTMARFNEVNLLCHFSHCGVDMIPDNTCHYGMNIFFADNGLLGQHPTPLYFPADPLQMEAVVKRIFFEPGIRFVFSTRPAVPYILDEQGNKYFEAGRYNFQPGKDELIRDGNDGFIVAFGDTLYRAVDAAETLKEQGYKVDVINKPTLNVVDEETLKKIAASRFVLVAETQNQITGLGHPIWHLAFGTWLQAFGNSQTGRRRATGTGGIPRPRAEAPGCGGRRTHSMIGVSLYSRAANGAAAVKQEAL